MSNSKLIFFLLILCISLEGFGQVRKYSNEFLAIGVGARSLGMANSNVASTNDITSGYWNPAGLMNIQSDLQLGFMHSSYFAGIANYDFGSVAIPVRDRERMIGVSLIRFAVDDIPNTLFLIDPSGVVNYDNITTFSVADYAFILSYAQPFLNENITVGANAKVIHRTAGGFANAWGFGLDAGAQMNRDRWRFGLMIRDVTTTFNAWSFNFTEEEQAIFAQTNNIIPENSYEVTVPRLIFGAGYLLPIRERFSLLGEVNVNLTTDGRRNVLFSARPFSIDPTVGLEIGYEDFVFLRAGMGNIQRIEEFDGNQVLNVQPNLGVGLRIRNIHIDYAYTDVVNQIEGRFSHVFSLKLDIYRRTTDN